MRPACHVGERRRLRIDPQAMPDRRRHVLERHRPAKWRSPPPICLAKDTPTTDPSAHEKRRRHRRPMIPPAVFVDLRRPTKLPPHHDDHVVEHPPRLEIEDEPREPGVEDRQHLPQTGIIAGMRVEVAQRDAHAAHASLHQPPGKEKLEHGPRPVGCLEWRQLWRRHGIAREHGRRFRLQIERRSHAAGGENPDRLIVKPIPAADRPHRLHLPLPTVERV